MANSFYLLAFTPLLAVATVQQCEVQDDDDTPDFGTPVPFVDCSDQTREFWAYDFSVMPPASQLVQATCRLEGRYAYVYVADDQWNTNVSTPDVEDFLTTFENQTPDGSIDPDRGIYQNDVVVFGNPPDELDNDPKVYLFLLDMADYTTDDGDLYQFDGYYGNMDQYTDEEIQQQTFGRYHSNEVEIVYLNSRIRPINDEMTLSVLAHEFQHMIAWNYDESEETWMSESLAEVAMTINGYYTDDAWVEDYASWPGYPLVYNGSPNYGACLLWGMYLDEQVGQDFMIPLEEEQRDGISGLNRALTNYGSEEDFDLLFSDWIVANVVDDPSTQRYGYDFAALPEFDRTALLGVAGDTTAGQVYPYGVDYIDIVPVRSSVIFEVMPDYPEFTLVRLIRWENGQMTEVTTLPADADGVFRAALSSDSPDVVWTAAISYTDASQAGDDTTMSYDAQTIN